MLGIPDANWAQIIIAMFSSGLSKLRIVNKHLPAYLDHNSVKVLREVCTDATR